MERPSLFWDGAQVATPMSMLAPWILLSRMVCVSFKPLPIRLFRALCRLGKYGDSTWRQSRAIFYILAQATWKRFQPMRQDVAHVVCDIKWQNTHWCRSVVMMHERVDALTISQGFTIECHRKKVFCLRIDIIKPQHIKKKDSKAVKWIHWCFTIRLQ